jgi:hypothetical protein
LLNIEEAKFGLRAYRHKLIIWLLPVVVVAINILVVEAELAVYLLAMLLLQLTPHTQLP